MRKRWWLVVAALACTALAVGGGASTSRAAPAAKPRPLPMTDPCVRGALRKRIVRFTAADSVRLIGVRLGSGPRGVVLGHMGGQDLCAWLPYARRLVTAGYNVLVFDFRQHGSSAYPVAVRKVWRIDLDMRAAVAALRRRGVQTVVVAGGSLGAIASVTAGSVIRPPVDGIVSLSAPARFSQVDAAAAAPHLTAPVLYVAADDDGEFAVDARRLYELTASQDKRLVVYPAGGHGINLFRGAAAAQAWPLFVEFLRTHSAP
jgi:pimeloyl-ACP methyl ester carboxylesterase